MAPTQTNTQPEASSSGSNSQDIAPTDEPGSLCYDEQRVVEQTDDMHWAIDVLSPLSESNVWTKSVATEMLVVLSSHGANQHIRQLSAVFLANRAGVVS